MRILVASPKGETRDSFIPGGVAEKLELLGEVVWNDTDQHFTPEELRDRLEGIDVCLTGWGNVPFTNEVLEKANDLKLIAHTGGTVASLVTDEVYDRGIRVLSGNDVYAQSVAEGVIAYILASLREIPHFTQVMAADGWHSGNWWNEGLLGQTVGLISFGAIAKYTVKMLQAFHVDIKVYSDHLSEEDAKSYGVQKASMEEIFSTCKIISIHSAATPKTYHMINDELLAKIQDSALLVNTSRGSVIDEQALAKHLKTGRFKAVLDVYEQEPLPMDSELRGLANVLLMPHMAGPTVDRRRFVTEGLIRDIQSYYEGKPLHLEISKDYAKRMTR